MGLSPASEKFGFWQLTFGQHCRWATMCIRNFLIPSQTSDPSSAIFVSSGWLWLSRASERDFPNSAVGDPFDLGMPESKRCCELNRVPIHMVLCILLWAGADVERSIYAQSPHKTGRSSCRSSSNSSAKGMPTLSFSLKAKIFVRWEVCRTRVLLL